MTAPRGWLLRALKAASRWLPGLLILVGGPLRVTTRMKGGSEE